MNSFKHIRNISKKLGGAALKDAAIKVRLTEAEKILLKEKAETANMTISDYVKWCCLINPPQSKK